MGVPTTTTLTFAEFERLPDHTGKRELVKGEVIELPPAKIKHDRASTGIYDRLKVALKRAHRRKQAAALGEVFMATGYYLKPDGWLIPDVSVTHASQSEHDYLEGSPAIAIEVASPGNSAEEIATKIALYFEHGAIEVWVIYPKLRQAHIHIGGQSHVIRESEPITTSLLPGFSLTLQDVL